MMRENVEFKSLDGTPLAAFLCTPDSGSGLFPAIVLSHGFGAVKEMALDRYADVFCAAGFACLVYDHRNTGSSGGALRGEIDPWQQISDMRDAITYVGSREEVDTDRIGRGASVLRVVTTSSWPQPTGGSNASCPWCRRSVDMRTRSGC